MGRHTTAMGNFLYVTGRESKRKDLRRHRRYALAGALLQVSWLDLNGKMRITNTRALNISEDGIALELPAPAMPLRIRFKSDRFKVNGMGTVRHCHRDGARYVVGLEFTEQLHWQPPAGNVREPIPLTDPESRS